ncbi:MAG: NADH-ubiquinone oxidoreductase-F iron-sulfur binding region domain-containing protein, partial [bacterium]
MKFDILKEEAKNEWQQICNSGKPRILVGAATCGRAAGAPAVIAAFKKTLANGKIDANLIEVGCLGPCCLEPMVSISKPQQVPIVYGNVKPEEVQRLVNEWLLGQNPCSDLALGRLGEEPLNGIPKFYEHPMLAPQVRIVLKNCGWIDPTDIKQYLANEGYTGFEKALQMSPEKVIAEVLQSGLRGRGGAGFPTGKKWQICRQVKSVQKYMICNADEGDPGAFMNRSLLEGDPHAVLEGLLIAGYAIGATEAYIYIRAEYPLAIQRLKLAISQMWEAGLLGENILDSNFNFNISIKEGAGAFVCGEETALIGSIEGKRGMPNTRPPFPAVSGLHGKPTIINNVETLGTLPHILRNGAEWYAQYGTRGSKGTKTFALAGKVQRTGLIEVPIGITLREIVYDVGGGIPNGKAFKAVQTGGPSGGCLPSRYLDSPVDYESLVAAGSIMGSGGMIVMDENTCAVDLAHYFLSFTQNESCGKCVPCRVGTKRMLEILDKIKSGLGTLEDLDMLESMAETVKSGSLCGLGQTAPNTVLTTLRYFRKEYEAHIKYKQCPAVVCQKITFTPCKYKCPIDTDIPAFLAHISRNEYHQAFEVIRKTNPFPIVTGLICHHPCEDRCRSAEAGGGPISIKALKRFVNDKELEGDFHPRTKAKRLFQEKIVIIGAGPIGVEFAYFFNEFGTEVHLVEMMPHILPVEDEEISSELEKSFTKLGIKLYTGTKVTGIDTSRTKLKVHTDK